MRYVPLTRLRDAEHARRMVRYSAEDGFDAIEVYRGITPSMLRVVVAYTNCGFDPIEAIRIATYEGARFLRIDKRTGTIAERKEADLVAVRGDPSKRMRDLDDIALVFANGVRYDPAKLLEADRGLYRFGPEHNLWR